MTDHGHEPNETAAGPIAPVRRRRRRTVVGGVLAAVATFATAVATVVGVGSEPAAAQAVPILVTVRTEPARPKPGDTVRVQVQVEGCHVGAATAEIYLETDDDIERSAVRVARGGLHRTVMMRTAGSVTLRAASEGWYGVRVLCANHHPARRSTPGTLFHVRPETPSVITAESNQSLAGTLRASGNNCPNGTVEWMLTNGFGPHSPFSANGTTAAGTDGTWSIDEPWPEGTLTGPVTLRARCGWDLDTMAPRWIVYPTRWDLTVTA